jgi:hypothetical protein
MAVKPAEGPDQGYFSLLRWSTDPLRDEARNVAVLLVGAKGGFSAFKPAALSSISPKLHEQGLLDAALVSLDEQVSSNKFTLERLEALHGSLQNSLYLTAPKPVAVNGLEETIKGLFKAFVAPRTGGSNRQSKGAVLDRVVNAYRRQGHTVKRGHYISDFIFDAVVEDDSPYALEVLSFATKRKDWAPIERDAGHFLFAIQELKMPGRAIVQPPTPASAQDAELPYARIRRWMDKFDVPVETADNVLDPQTVLPTGGD